MKKPKEKDLPPHRKKQPSYGLVIAVFFVGITSGFLLGEGLPFLEKPQAIGSQQERLTGYKFISPLLACDISTDAPENAGLLPLKQDIEKKIASLKDSDRLSRASVYFRILGTGQWFSVHGQDRFSAASLVKLPGIFAALKTEELNPSFSNKKAEFTGASICTGKLEQNIKPAKTLQPGHSYSLDELLLRTITYSDNDAFALLTQLVDPTLIVKATNDLRFPLPDPQTGDDFVSISDVANCFRILYNATYLNENMSEKGLDMLSRADFKDGINSGVPSNITVAHKFGERGFIGSPRKELHDCGIVYYPGNPYLLCVMTEGSSFKDLADSIRDISLTAYQNVDHSYATPN